MVKRTFPYFIGLWALVVIFAGISAKVNIFRSSDVETYLTNTKKGYLENSFLARVSYNKVTFYFNRYLDNFFAGVDPNYFFFGGHPREVPGGDNSLKVSYWLIPFFLFGVYEQIRAKEKKIFFVYLLTLVLVSWFSTDKLWWYLVPFIYLTMLYPLKRLWKK